MTDELKCCPFCGSPDITRGTSWTSDGTFDYRECKSCKCRGPLVPANRESLDNAERDAAWNTRHNESSELPEWAKDAIKQGIEYAIVNANANTERPILQAKYFALRESLEWCIALRKPEG